MARPVAEVARELDDRVADLGFELVEAIWAGSDRRPILRIRVDRPEGSGDGVTIDDCAAVSRGLEPWLDALDAMPTRYTLEVSSPGVDRPLVRPRDYERFAGEMVAVKGDDLLAGRARRLEGELLGLDTGAGDGRHVRLRLPNGDEVAIALDEIVGAHIVYRWS
jgi:ribosome maturation factor RimP